MQVSRRSDGMLPGTQQYSFLCDVLKQVTSFYFTLLFCCLQSAEYRIQNITYLVIGDLG